MNLVHYTPNRWFDFPFDRIFDEFWPGTQANGPVSEGLLPRVDIREEKEAVILTAELPGVEKENLKVELENGILTLQAEKKAEHKEEENGFYRSERVFGTFKRQFKVPTTVDAEKIGAEYMNGVLKVILPKHPEAAPREIEIRAENSGVKQIKAK